MPEGQSKEPQMTQDEHPSVLHPEDYPVGAPCKDPDCITTPHLMDDPRCVSYDPPDEAPPVELPAIDEMVALLHESNEVRVRDLEAKSGGQASLENAFDVLKMLVLLEHIALRLEALDEALLDFEGKRAEMISKIEDQYGEMLAARDLAERQAKLTSGVGPNRAARRHPGPSGIVRP